MQRNAIWWLVLLFLAMVLSGTTLYSMIEGWNFLDSLYMTVNVLTTIGFNEVHPLSNLGKVFTIFYSLMGFFILAGVISVASSHIIENYVLGDRRTKKMLKQIKKMKNHFIICGSGKVGRHVIRAMAESKKNYVVIDSQEKYKETFYEELRGSREFNFISGDATKEEVLLEANVEEAYGLVSCLPEDHQNLFIALTAKKINPAIHISTYVKEENNINKFYHIGVDEVVSGDFVVGKRLATSLLNKNIAAFLEQTTAVGEGEAFFLGDVEVGEDSPVVGKSIRGANIFRSVGLLIFAIRRKELNKYMYNPDPETILRRSDVLMTFGSEKDIQNLKEFINPKKSFLS